MTAAATASKPSRIGPRMRRSGDRRFITPTPDGFISLFFIVISMMVVMVAAAGPDQEWGHHHLPTTTPTALISHRHDHGGHDDDDDDVNYSVSSSRVDTSLVGGTEDPHHRFWQNTPASAAFFHPRPPRLQLALDLDDPPPRDPLRPRDAALSTFSSSSSSSSSQLATTSTTTSTSSSARPLRALSTGTTIVGLVGPGYVVLATDTRSTTAGPGAAGGAPTLVADTQARKLHRLAGNVVAAGAGTAADLDHLTRQARYTLEYQRRVTQQYGNAPRDDHHQVDDDESAEPGGEELDDREWSSTTTTAASSCPVDQVCTWLLDQLRAQGGSCQAHLLVGGIDDNDDEEGEEEGEENYPDDPPAANSPQRKHYSTQQRRLLLRPGQLRALHPHGSLDILRFGALGSGGYAAMAVLQSRYHPHLTLAQAQDLALAAVQAGLDHDLGSGSQIDLCVIQQQQLQQPEPEEEEQQQAEPNSPQSLVARVVEPPDPRLTPVVGSTGEVSTDRGPPQLTRGRRVVVQIRRAARPEATLPVLHTRPPTSLPATSSSSPKSPGAAPTLDGVNGFGNQAWMVRSRRWVLPGREYEESRQDSWLGQLLPEKEGDHVDGTSFFRGGEKGSVSLLMETLHSTSRDIFSPGD